MNGAAVYLTSGELGRNRCLKTVTMIDGPIERKVTGPVTLSEIVDMRSSGGNETVDGRTPSMLSGTKNADDGDDVEADVPVGQRVQMKDDEMRPEMRPE